MWVTSIGVAHFFSVLRLTKSPQLPSSGACPGLLPQINIRVPFTVFYFAFGVNFPFVS